MLNDRFVEASAISVVVNELSFKSWGIPSLIVSTSAVRHAEARMPAD
jgi:hypothetical protein